MAKKKSYQLKNHFIYEGYESPDYFCDRIVESENLIAHLQNGRNVTLVSPRKIGKTGLIQHTFHLIKEQIKMRFAVMAISFMIVSSTFG